MTGRICRQRQHCDNLHFPLVLWPQCVHLNVHLFDNGQRKETRGECISQLCDWALYLLTMYLSIIPCKHVGVCSAVYILPLCGCCPPGCISQSRLPDVTGRLDIMLKRTKMYSWVVAQEAQFTACCLSLTKERQIWWIHGPIAEYDGLCWSLGARQNIVGGVHKLLNLSERVTLLSSTQGKVCKWHSRSKKEKIRRKHEWTMANICLKRSFWKREAAREINLIYLCDV
jgi:hypothetical protein